MPASGNLGGSRERTMPIYGPSLITPKGQRRDPTRYKAKEGLRWYDDERREEKQERRNLTNRATPLSPSSGGRSVL